MAALGCPHARELSVLKFSQHRAALSTIRCAGCNLGQIDKLFVCLHCLEITCEECNRGHRTHIIMNCLDSTVRCMVCDQWLYPRSITVHRICVLPYMIRFDVSLTDDYL